MTKNYSIYIDGFDFGPCVTEATLDVDGMEDASKLKVTEKKMAVDFTKPTFPTAVGEFPRTVTGVKTVDGKTVVSLNASPMEGNPLVFTMPEMVNRWADPYELHFEYDGKKLDLNDKPESRTYVTDALFEERTFTATDGISMKYGVYKPKEDTHNLIIWLHGMGEGGNDVTIDVLGNKVFALAQDHYQEAVGGAWVLAPQSPTFWMDKTGDSPISENDGTSYYTKALIELIKAFEEEIQADKVVLSGCSNGGFMTMRLAIDAPELFDGYIPICEALADQFITDEDIQNLAKLPMYFIYAEDDTTVKPDLFEIPTIERLKKAGADKLHVFHPADVHDTTGLYKGPDGKPWKYMGHWSWIYYFNDECVADGVKTSDFIKKCFEK